MKSAAMLKNFPGVLVHITLIFVKQYIILLSYVSKPRF